jgi:hypothetical protein
MPLGIEQLVRGVHPKAVRGLFHGKAILTGYKCVDPGKRPRWVLPCEPSTACNLVQNIHIFLTLTNSPMKHHARCVSVSAPQMLLRPRGLNATNTLPHSVFHCR